MSPRNPSSTAVGDLVSGKPGGSGSGPSLGGGILGDRQVGSIVRPRTEAPAAGLPLGNRRLVDPSLLRPTPGGIVPPIPPTPTPGGPTPAPPVGVVSEIVGQAGVIGGSSRRHRGLVHHYYHYPHFYASFPFVGYYSLYDYPYVSYYGCDFYGRFGFRFGPLRLRLYSVCGVHYGHRHHHCHRYSCSVHGFHHYRSRDCYECYPTDHTHIVHESLERESPRAEELVQALQPAELSFCEGWVLLREGRYVSATESFYNASLELPQSGLIHFYLGLSLAAQGEIELAAAALAEARELSPRLLAYSADAVLHFGDESKVAEIVQKIADFTRLHPARTEGWVTGATLGLFMAKSLEDIALAKRQASEATLFDRNSTFGLALLAEADRRERGAVFSDPASQPNQSVQLWLSQPSCESIGVLELGEN